MSDPNLRLQLEAALNAAKTGDFSGLDAIVAAVAHEDGEVRIKAAYCCERIGFAAATDPLSRMAAGDPVSDNRNQAIYALASIGRPAVVPPLIACLSDDDPARRDDARTALYRVLGEDALRQLADEDDEGARDDGETARVTAWWDAQSARFDPARVYAFGQLAGPAVFIALLEAAAAALPDAYLDALSDWTGQDFGQTPPLSKVITKWSKWWAANSASFEPGRRYFYSHPVP